MRTRLGKGHHPAHTSWSSRAWTVELPNKLSTLKIKRFVWLAPTGSRFAGSPSSHVTPAVKHTTTGCVGLKWSPLHPGKSCIMAANAQVDDIVSRLLSCLADTLLSHITNFSLYKLI